MEILNKDRLLESSAGIPEFMKDVITAFLSEMSMGLGRLEDASRSADLTAISEESHYLKGSCQTVGADRLSDVFSKIHVECSSDNCSVLPSTMNEARTEFELVRSEMEKLMRETPS